MGATTNTGGGGLPRAPSKRAEFLTFLVLAFGVWPFVAVGVVGGFGLAVWIFQMIFGPPGPPAVLH
ncbi:nitrate reductase [Pseudoxanthobacter sp. M-2]|uniref:nitrate reductase n=1 Tax=Pseudoxanthobacter sp. M-2 TaxID=3078754 RepID=UPI0038FC581E